MLECREIPASRGFGWRQIQAEGLEVYARYTLRRSTVSKVVDKWKVDLSWSVSRRRPFERLSITPGLDIPECCGEEIIKTNHPCGEKRMSASE